MISSNTDEFGRLLGSIAAFNGAVLYLVKRAGENEALVAMLEEIVCGINDSKVREGFETAIAQFKSGVASPSASQTLPD